VQCPHCGKVHTAETALERWIRNHESLDSIKEGIVRFDCDILLHKYLVKIDKKGTREIQCMMFIEAKTHGADVSVSQQDTLSLFSQVLRNRRTNMHCERRGRHAREHTPLTMAYSFARKRWIRLRLYGGHLLQLSGESPADSTWIKWDRRLITEDMLLSLLRFDIDPDTLQEIDWRRRYSAFTGETAQMSLWGIA
jgi:hypothetical protein